LSNELASYLITFRESLEAALIITIIATYLTKLNRNDLKKYMWLGSLAAIATSLLAGAAIFLLFGQLTGLYEKLFEGTAAITATAVLTYMIFWMAKNARKIKGEIQTKVDLAVTAGSLLGIALLAYVAVVREGIETVLFLTALASADPYGTAIGGLIGVATVLALSFGIMKGIYRLDLRVFFKATSIVLVIFAAGLLGYGIHELMEAGEAVGLSFGPLGWEIYNINNVDPTGLLNENGPIGSMLKSIVGYDSNPELLRIAGYLAYWVIVGVYLVKNYTTHAAPTVSGTIQLPKRRLAPSAEE
jgi:high-affinity iron transporter